MAFPTVVAVGTVASGVATATPGLPAGWALNDILIIVCESAEQTAGVPGLPSGYAYLNSVQVPITGTVATKLTMMWKRATASESAPVVPDPGDHIVARMVAVRGCRTTGNPWNTTATATEAVADTSASWPAVTPTRAECLILNAIATGQDVASTANLSAHVNANLGSVTEQMDNWVIDGNGGGFGLISGTRIPGGVTTGATTATVGVATNNFKALATVAFDPVYPNPWIIGSWETQGTAAAKSVSYTPPADAVLILVLTTNTQASATTASVTTPGAIAGSWTLIGSRGGQAGHDASAVHAWWARAPSAPSATTTTTTTAGGSNHDGNLTLIALDHNAVDLAVPIGVTTGANLTDSTQAQSQVLTPQTGGVGFLGGSDWNATGFMAAGAGEERVSTSHTAAQVSTGLMVSTATMTAGSAYTLNLSLGSAASTVGSLFAFEVRAAAAAASRRPRRQYPHHRR